VKYSPSKYSTQYCTLEASSDHLAGFITFENETFFSVPEPTNVQVSCSHNSKQFTEPQVLAGIGKFILPQGCQMQIGEDVNIRPGYVFSREILEGNKIFSILTKAQDTLMIFPDEPNVTITTFRPLRLREITHINDAMNIIFNDETAAILIVRIIAIAILCFGAMTAVYCIFPKFRHWLNACCFFVKPTLFWNRVRGYEGLPDMISERKREMIKKNNEATYIRKAQQDFDEDLKLDSHYIEIEPDPKTHAFPHLHALLYPNFRKNNEVPAYKPNI